MYLEAKCKKLQLRIVDKSPDETNHVAKFTSEWLKI